GTRHRYFRPTRKEARALEDSLRVEKWRQLREGVAAPELRDLTVAEFGARWLRDCASRLKPRTLRSYEQNFRCYVVPPLGKMKVSDVRRVHLKQLLVQKHEEGFAKDSIRLIRATV